MRKPRIKFNTVAIILGEHVIFAIRTSSQKELQSNVDLKPASNVLKNYYHQAIFPCKILFV